MFTFTTLYIISEHWAFFKHLRSTKTESRARSVSEIHPDKWHRARRWPQLCSRSNSLRCWLKEHCSTAPGADHSSTQGATHWDVGSRNIVSPCQVLFTALLKEQLIEMLAQETLYHHARCCSQLYSRSNSLRCWLKEHCSTMPGADHSSTQGATHWDVGSRNIVAPYQVLITALLKEQLIEMLAQGTL